jgi:signal recognition particle subunit SRP54
MASFHCWVSDCWLVGTTFTLDDFLAAMDQMKRMGPMKSLMKLFPGMPQAVSADPDQDVARVRAMIQAMTPAERQKPDRIDASRRNRIARGSGTDPNDIGDLIRQFQGMQRMMERIAEERRTEFIPFRAQ